MIARPVFAEKLPTAIPRLAKISKALGTLHGEGCTMTQHGTFFVFYTPGEYCNCAACAHLIDVVMTTAGADWMETMQKGMIVCATCGCKRCPHATDHAYDCTGSNEPGQEGSSYQ